MKMQKKTPYVYITGRKQYRKSTNKNRSDAHKTYTVMPFLFFAFWKRLGNAINEMK